MTTKNDPYGDQCPFCKTAVPLDATVCTGCHARKGTRMDAMDPIHQWARFFVWASTVGLAACVAVTSWSTWNKSHDFGQLVIAVCATALTYGVHRMYKALLGTVADPQWIRNV